MRLGLTLFVCLLISCGEHMRNSTSPAPIKYLGCSVEQTVTGATITCPDGTQAFLSNGVNGINGTDGSSCSVQQTSSGATIACSNGTSAHIYNGTNGSNGIAGVNGLNGADGSTCSVLQNSNSAIITCGTSKATISNGLNGAGCDVTDASNGAIVTCGLQSVVIYDGENAAIQPYNIVGVVDPCGDSPGFDEVLLRLGNGQLMAHYSQGNKQFLTLLSPGNFETTDGTACQFNVSNTNQVSW